MGLNQIKCWLLLLVWLCVFETFSASNFISDDVFGSRRLLQIKQKCPIDFENQNYTIITSRCKPKSTTEDCCPAYIQFSCPFAKELNDLRNDCLDTMFSYIYINKIPQGLLSSLCRGFTCPAAPPAPSLSEKGAYSSSSTSRPAASVAHFLRALAVVSFTTVVFI